MRVLIDLIILLIIALCAWRGWKKGLIVGLCGLLALGVSVYAADVISKAYYADYTQILDPVISGYTDTSTGTVTAEIDPEDEEAKHPYVELTKEEKEDVYSVTYAVMRQCGVAADPSEKIAAEFDEQYDKVDYALIGGMGEYLTARITYVLLFAAVFVLIYALFCILENILNLTFSLPGVADYVNRGLGAVAGVLRAIALLLVICCVCRYLGILLGNDRIVGTVFFEKLINSNFIANRLGI